MADTDTLILCKDVHKRFCRDLKQSLWYGVKDMARDFLGGHRTDYPDIILRKNEFWAVNNLSFKLRRGEALGLIGHNGAGKTTLLKMLNGLLKPDKGRIEIRGRIGALIALGAGFNPILTGRENVYINGTILGLKKREIDEKFESILDFAELEDFIDMPVQSYSSGMQVRLGFAVAAHMNPDILLIDEVLAVGDLRFRKKCHDFIADYTRRGGAYILVTHNLHTVHSICQDALVMDRGRQVFLGNSSDAVAKATALQKQSTRAGRTGSAQSAPAASSQEIALHRCEVVGPGQEAPAPGSGISIRLHYESRLPTAKVAWSFAIWSGDGTTRLGSCHSKNQDSSFTLGPGKGVLRCEIANLPLPPGSYQVKGALSDIGTGSTYVHFGFEDTPGQFTLQSRSPSHAWSAASDDQVYLNPTWTQD